MNFLARKALLVLESLVYGPAYGTIQHAIRNPRPLTREQAWNVTTPKHPLLDWIAFTYPPTFLRPLLVAAKLRQDHVLGIADHYDVSNEFFELWHDKEYRFYTAGDFCSPDDTLEVAQRRKADRFIELLQPRAGEKILDMGPGWNPMLRRIYEETGDKDNLYGYTLSKEQVKFNEATDGFRVEFRDFITTDYEPEFFDKLYSIETLEHCRPRDIPMLAAKLYKTLKPGGIAVHQMMCRLPPHPTAAAACTQIFFPGSFPSSYQHLLRSWEGAGFRIISQDIIDYRPTLKAWFDRLIENRDRAVELVGPYNYNRYLLMCSSGWNFFNYGLSMDIRFTMEKPKVRTSRSVPAEKLVHA